MSAWWRREGLRVCVIAFIAVCVFVAAAPFVHDPWKLIIAACAYLVLVMPHLGRRP